ncbi:MAG: hypothetical protein IKJ99_08200 [Oscillospiraceae bacterium]|nr:hypothetical protein [Oscillospiraceae bacterium]
MERISRFRALVLLLIVALVLTLYAGRLFRLQIIETDGNTDNTQVYSVQTRVKAARGDILDRNGNILVGNRASYDLVFNHYVIKSADNTNDHLYKLINMCNELGIEYQDHFPVTRTRPFEYTLDDYTSAWRGYFQKFLGPDWCDIDSDITAPLLVEKLKEIYDIPAEWNDDVARAIIGLRYEFDLRGVTNLSSYVFLEDVDDDTLSELLELNIPGLMVESSTVREYYTHYAAHILGTMGAMDEDQWLEVKESGEYYMDAQVGQSGFEAAFEEWLHGIDGMRLDKVDKNGTFISQEYIEGKEPKAGNNVETTIDINIQIAAEDALADIIEYLKDPESDPKTTDGEDVEGASVVVQLVKTGEILACASYPTYDLTTFNEDYDEILLQDFDPLFNRALQGTYYPGSTYKMCTLVAAMKNGHYQPNEEIEDKGVFEEYAGFSPKCLVYSSHGITHGFIDSTTALEVSCNYFFYELAYRMNQEGRGIKDLDEVAQALGFGEYTGVELYEAKGYRANAESKAATHKGFEKSWFPGDTIQASIGQSTNMITPIQMCTYVATLANEGTRMKTTFLNRVVSADYRTLVFENAPKIANVMELDASIVKAYKEGMKAVIKGSLGTARNTMRGLPVEVCAKTGTAQTGRAGSDDGYFVCFAPYDDPVIAIAVHGEKAAHGATLGQVARAIINVYFDSDDNIDVGYVHVYENQIG